MIVVVLDSMTRRIYHADITNSLTDVENNQKEYNILTKEYYNMANDEIILNHCCPVNIITIRDRALISGSNSMFRYGLVCLLYFIYSLPLLAANGCGDRDVWLQVLGSGGPEINDGRASSSYLIWRDGKARILVDMGGGSLLRFEQSGAQLSDLDVILLTHLHVDHSADLPYLIKASFFTPRDRDLPIYGPSGNQLMPATTDFVGSLFNSQGAFRYLADYLDGSESFRLLPYNIKASGKTRRSVLKTSDYRIDSVPVHHGPIPALAWRVEMAGHVMVFSGDMNNDYNTLAELAAGADLLVAHHAIAEQAGKVARNLHMPPSVIGQIATRAKVKHLLLSHRMQRTMGHEVETKQLIVQHYRGPMDFAEDLQCIKM
jgi:ribonuclease BN (tRNA processing enzyme)